MNHPAKWTRRSFRHQQTSHRRETNFPTARQPSRSPFHSSPSQKSSGSSTLLLRQRPRWTLVLEDRLCSATAMTSYRDHPRTVEASAKTDSVTSTSSPKAGTKEQPFHSSQSILHLHLYSCDAEEKSQTHGFLVVHEIMTVMTKLATKKLRKTKRKLTKMRRTSKMPCLATTKMLMTAQKVSKTEQTHSETMPQCHGQGVQALQPPLIRRTGCHQHLHEAIQTEFGAQNLPIGPSVKSFQRPSFAEYALHWSQMLLCSCFLQRLQS
jgi:hypothetical protein